MRTTARWIALLTLLLGATACSGRPLDKASMELSIQAQLESKTGVSGFTVTCPGNIQAQTGGTFTCTAAAQGETVTLQVTQTDDQGHVTFTIAR